MARPKASARVTRQTALVVGEGYAEVLVLGHIRSLYTGDREGVRLTVKNARGRGAAHVVDMARRHAAVAAYDTAAALFDVDTSCTAAARQLAKRGRIELLEQDPCLEAWLLAVHGIQNPDYTTAQHKRLFERQFGCEAHESSYLGRFDREAFDRARESIEVLDNLLTLIGIPT